MSGAKKHNNDATEICGQMSCQMRANRAVWTGKLQSHTDAGKHAKETESGINSIQQEKYSKRRSNLHWTGSKTDR